MPNTLTMDLFLILSLFFGVYSSSLVAAAAERIGISIGLKNKSIGELIEMLRAKYGIKTIEDVGTWTTAEEMGKPFDQSDVSEGAGKVPFWYKDVFSLLFAFRSVAQDTERLFDYIGKEPILREILLRDDCPVKFVFVPSKKITNTYMYDSRKPNSEHEAYILAMHDVEWRMRSDDIVYGAEGKVIDAGDNYYETAYIDGKIFAYPEDAVRAYIGPKNWDRAKKLGEAWIDKNRTKSVEQLKLEIWQRIQEREKRNFVK